MQFKTSIDEMGKVFTTLTVINRADQILAENDIISPDQVRAVKLEAAQLQSCCAC